ncbi:natural killer cells antigen CD94-like [Ornithorhynchus anatinus]|uniref:Natural killer cells antigen CD94 n=1 Tax=Ornithorhynchus anatinus TaxID=9258 RepID=A0A6I8NXG0_ORNAN|nr:natural killer cells antigen CD94-like [Ornithorhynchus anatinus]XP_028938729.1 natural killer cells antigen CD94-like [Ornithorhynchus anatinus]
MSEPPILYTELKQKTSSQSQPKRTKTSMSKDPGREQELAYVELELQRPSQQQRKSERVNGKDAPASVWQLTAVTLVIFCLGLLLTVGVLAAQGLHCGTCPENWFLYGNNCYLFSKEERKWDESQAICRSQNSMLLKLENKGELDFLSLFALYGWTGLYRSGRNQTWKWSDGSNLSIGLLHITLDESGKDCAKYHPSNPASPEECESLQKYICKYRIP